MKNRIRLVALGTDTNAHGAFVKRMKQKLDENPAVFDLLDAWWPEDLLKISYLRESEPPRYEELKKGSAGQKAAAILAFLLSYGEEPLLLDQPEDDLDNAIITDLIVKQIHENRQRRQVVVITHNPNIVVNGDADLVHVLGFEKGQIHRKSSGSLEEEGIRIDICTIMEGGRIAFQTRYHRITLED
jgi:ATPase subunit of ABC transporter with duplicated ATPase domains